MEMFIMQTPEELAVAEGKLQEVETLVSVLADAEGRLEKGYARLAFMLKEISEQRYWEPAYKSFGKFLDHLSQDFNLKKSQLYSYLSTARELGGTVTEEQLNSMGISKACVLRDTKVATGGVVADSVITAALDPKVTVEDLKKLLYDSSILTAPEDGVWMNLDFSCYVTDEEKSTIDDAANAARHLDPSIDEKMKPSAQMKEILLRWSREFLAAYSNDVVEGGRGL
jgi:hypothetical protein